MKTSLITLCILFLAAHGLLGAEETMDITSKDGRTIKAEVLEVTADSVKVKMAGKEFAITFDKLEDETVAKLKAMMPKGKVESAGDPKAPFLSDAGSVFAKFTLGGARPVGEKVDLLVTGGTLAYSAGQGTIFYEIDCEINTEVSLPAPAPVEGNMIVFRSNWLMASRQLVDQDDTRCVGWLDDDDMFHREAFELRKPIAAGEKSSTGTVRGRLLVLAAPGANVFHVRCLTALQTVTVTDAPRAAPTPAQEVGAMLDKLTAALQEKMPMATLMETFLMPEDFTKLRDSSKFERMAEDYYEKDGAALLLTIQSLDREKVTITDMKAEFPKEDGKPFVLEKAGDKWYFRD